MSKTKGIASELKKNIPFSLDSLEAEHFFIELYPENNAWLAAVKLKRPLTARKLYECLVSKDTENGEVWGLSLPKIYGLSTGERVMISSGSNRQKAVNDYLKLVSRINKTTNIPFNELQPMLDRPFDHVDVLGDFIGELTAISGRIDSNSRNQLDIITVILRERLINSWDEDDTNALCEGLFKEFYNYVEQEQGQWEVLDDEEVIAPESGEVTGSISTEE